ncbi:hypothetical protein Pla123a_08660 [Posidoniimonas polymericola]|uniref:PEP-CTERM protein-sorting domain-containing protein n=1 Tax=Posidoniimonas polymericola TaxID=2528002 RepID=A0A5C5YTS9_9BACT|nr:VPLPA-CTERM sorting domain-containing protein [Posidoniimonas polymericola]TWT78077.1 hypothetical protein Pla123a_08660 [Posidoniimonas polymericola]
MNRTLSLSVLSSLLSATAVVASAAAAPVYLNQDNMTVVVGPGTSSGTFHNTFNSGATITKVIDAPSADAEEFHDQSTHIWFTADDVGGGLELVFEFDASYDIDTLHFWNYTSEGYDVDNVDFFFFNAGGAQVGALSVQPDLGSSGGIEAQDIALAAPLNVKSVTAFLTGSNREVDFQNIGFSAELSQVPSPAASGLLLAGLITATGRRRSRG